MAPHSSTLAWKIPWTEEPGGLQSMGSLRVRHDWATSLSLFTFMHWRRKWQPTPVFLPEKYHGLSSMAGYSPWDHKEWNITEWLSTHADLQNHIYLFFCDLISKELFRLLKEIIFFQSLTLKELRNDVVDVVNGNIPGYWDSLVAQW